MIKIDIFDVMIRLFFIGTLLIVSHLTLAQDYTATGGEWTDAASWGGSGPPAAPGDDGTTILIPSGVTITITNQTVDYNGTIEVYGTISLLATGGFFTPAGVLNMDGTSLINVYTNGSITSGGGGFWEGLNSIVIDNNFFPPAFNDIVDGGNLDGPISLDPTGQPPLPVELIYFNANSIQQEVELSWATAEEENFDYFSLERSIDGVDFKEIAQIMGVGNSTARVDYEYFDEFPLNGLSYYRLTSIDFDGYTEVFDYVVVNVDGLSDDFAVFPNPVVDGKFSIQTNFYPKLPLDLIIYNNVGRVEGEYKITDWLNDFDSINLQPGSYILKMTTPEGVVVKRILIK